MILQSANSLRKLGRGTGNDRRTDKRPCRQSFGQVNSQVGEFSDTDLLSDGRDFLELQAKSLQVRAAPDK